MSCCNFPSFIVCNTQDTHAVIRTYHIYYLKSKTAFQTKHTFLPVEYDFTGWLYAIKCKIASRNVFIYVCVCSSAKQTTVGTIEITVGCVLEETPCCKISYNALSLSNKRNIKFIYMLLKSASKRVWSCSSIFYPFHIVIDRSKKLLFPKVLIFQLKMYYLSFGTNYEIKYLVI